jgi:hypothetical protein
MDDSKAENSFNLSIAVCNETAPVEMNSLSLRKSQRPITMRRTNSRSPTPALSAISHPKAIDRCPHNDAHCAPSPLPLVKAPHQHSRYPVKPALPQRLPASQRPLRPQRCAHRCRPTRESESCAQPTTCGAGRATACVARRRVRAVPLRRRRSRIATVRAKTARKDARCRCGIPCSQRDPEPAPPPAARRGVSLLPPADAVRRAEGSVGIGPMAGSAHTGWPDSRRP